MDALLEKAIAEAYASAPQNVIILHAIEINHPAFSEPARVIRWPVTDNEPTRFRCLLEDDAPYNAGQVVEFIGLPFNLSLPDKGDSPGNFEFRIDNVGDLLDEELEAAALQGGQITAIYREFIKGRELEGPASDPWYDISITSPHMEGQTIVATGTVLNWIFKPYGKLYLPSDYPALVRGR
jgi:hypothetical protein